MPARDIVVIGASAGGLEPLTAIVQSTTDLRPVAMLVVMHTSTSNETMLPRILARHTRWPVLLAADGQPIEPGKVYVAQPDRHMLVTANGLQLSRGPRENGFRPAIDPLFRTAARGFGRRVIGVLLSGALGDGTYGLGVVKKAGGIAVVQHPEEALMPSMPLSAIRQVDVDHILPAREIGPLIASLAEEQTRGASGMSKTNEPEVQFPGVEVEIRDMMQDLGPPSGLTCPDCGAALWEVENGELVRYKCHVGHQYSPDGLVGEQDATVEGALWTAVRVLEEHAELRMRLSRRAEGAGLSAVSEGLAERARESQRQASQIRELLFDGRSGPLAGDVPARRRSERRPSAPGRFRRKARATR